MFSASFLLRFSFNDWWNVLETFYYETTNWLPPKYSLLGEYASKKSFDYSIRIGSFATNYASVNRL